MESIIEHEQSLILFCFEITRCNDTLAIKETVVSSDIVLTKFGHAHLDGTDFQEGYLDGIILCYAVN